MSDEKKVATGTDVNAAVAQILCTCGDMLLLVGGAAAAIIWLIMQ